MLDTSIFTVALKSQKDASFRAKKLAEKLAESKVQSTDITAMKTIVIFEGATVR